ncbi:MAG: rhomboid family intramembrane serine protease [Candidatus Aenigmarchaeota archaeon]|nr:rhomboid family intramembrane serine protease [Candidatus Aenigmarchaeota archaeon]
MAKKKSKVKITYIILAANVLLFFFTIIPYVFYTLALTPTQAIYEKKYWQFFTFMYVHGGFEHLFLNMFSLLVFGPRIEAEMGKWKFFVFYTISGIFSGIFHILITGINAVPLIGASGAIFAVLTAFGIMFPKDIVYVNLLLPLPAYIFVILMAVLQFIYGISNAQPGVSNYGHLGGMIAGFVMIKFFGFGKKKVKYFWEN